MAGHFYHSLKSRRPHCFLKVSPFRPFAEDYQLHAQLRFLLQQPGQRAHQVGVGFFFRKTPHHEYDPVPRQDAQAGSRGLKSRGVCSAPGAGQFHRVVQDGNFFRLQALRGKLGGKSLADRGNLVREAQRPPVQAMINTQTKRGPGMPVVKRNPGTVSPHPGEPHQKMGFREVGLNNVGIQPLDQLPEPPDHAQIESKAFLNAIDRDAGLQRRLQKLVRAFRPVRWPSPQPLKRAQGHFHPAGRFHLLAGAIETEQVLDRTIHRFRLDQSQNADRRLPATHRGQDRILRRS